jgi:hypothetical protein
MNMQLMSTGQLTNHDCRIVLDLEYLDHCEDCRLKRQIQLSYHSSESVSQPPFDHVH